MKKDFFRDNFLITILLIITIFTITCKTTEDTQYNLTVNLDDGVKGTPEEGIYTYEPGDVVQYSYELVDSYSNLVVKLDGQEIDASGSITISKNHTLSATTDPVYNITGSWELEEEYDDGSSFKVTITFTGSSESGTVADSHGGTGTYTVDTYNRIEFNLEFPDMTYEYDGKFSDVDTISGDAKRKSSTDSVSGTWTATRIE
jgi:hypothetical protein